MKKAIIIIAAATLLLNGCQEKWMPAGAGSGNNIWFSASRSATKTVYNSEDDLQIDWVTGDRIKIYCAEAEDVKEATYSVTRKETFNHGYLTCVSSEGLKWGGDTGEHNFFAVYPASSAMTVEGGIATCTVNANQICTVNNSGDNLIADPDMTNAYMVANLSTEPVDKVELHFRPIMTTLKITIRAKTGTNQAPATVTGVSITSTTNCYSNTFGYNIASGQIISGSKSNTVTTFVGIKNGDDSHVDLAANQTLTLTAFIPPVNINSDNPVKIRLHAQNSQDLIVTLGKTEATSVGASTKRLITLPNIPSVETVGNNWITPLDDNIYVSQLSIPGTHDAATGDGTTFSMGKTQDRTLDQQFEMGIRAFDLRPAVNSDRVMIFCHGAVATRFSWDEVMGRFKDYLRDNPGEFIIALLRHEDEFTALNGLTDENSDDRWKPRMQTKLEEMKASINPATGESYTIDFRPDLTVGEMRGKILFMCRDWTKYNDNGPVVGGYMGWDHSKNGAEVSIYGVDGSRGTLNIQDCYAPAESGDWNFWQNGNNADLVRNFPSVKWAAIESLLNKSATFHTNPELRNRWSFNHTSGYTGYILVVAYSVSSTDRYRENAANNHIKFYNKITSPDWKGSTGIILSDFVGARSSGNYTVYGDLLPQAIIDNNYKYHMVRKQ